MINVFEQITGFDLEDIVEEDLEMMRKQITEELHVREENKYKNYYKKVIEAVDNICKMGFADETALEGSFLEESLDWHALSECLRTTYVFYH